MYISTERMEETIDVEGVKDIQEDVFLLTVLTQSLG